MADPVNSNTVGGYRLIRKLGQGSSAEAFLAENSRGELFALKMFKPVVENWEERALQEFENGKIIAENCGHTIRYLEHFHAPIPVSEIIDEDLFDETTLILVTGYLPGKTLYEIVRDYSLIPRGIVRILTQTLRIVKCIHDLQMIHGDLNMKNLVNHREQIYLLDMGASCDYNQKKCSFGSIATPLIYRHPLLLSREQRAYLRKTKQSQVGEYLKANDLHSIGVHALVLMNYKIVRDLKSGVSNIDNFFEETIYSFFEEYRKRYPGPEHQVNLNKIDRVLGLIVLNMEPETFTSADALLEILES